MKRPSDKQHRLDMTSDIWAMKDDRTIDYTYKSEPVELKKQLSSALLAEGKHVVDWDTNIDDETLVIVVIKSATDIKRLIFDIRPTTSDLEFLLQHAEVEDLLDPDIPWIC